MNQEEQKNVPTADTTQECPDPSESFAESADPIMGQIDPPQEDLPTSDVLAPKAAGVQIILRPIHLVIAAACTLAIVAGGILLGIQINKWTVDPDIDPDAEKYPYPGVTDVAEGQIAVPGYSTLSFPANSRKVNVVLPNPDKNPCYFVFAIVLTETGETIYRSEMVPPGMALTEITLFRPLESGTYSIEIHIETFSLEDKSSMNGATVKATLLVS